MIYITNENNLYLEIMTNVPSSTTNDAVISGAPTELDLAFIIDATSSMSGYITSAQEVCIFVYEKP